MRIKKGFFYSPGAVLFFYILLAGFLIMAFRFILPGEESLLEVYYLRWRLIRGTVDFLSLFPSLAMSALVIPFGLKFLEEKNSFVPVQGRILDRLQGSIITAIAAAVVYSLLFFLVQPLARDYETSMRFNGRLYTLARDRAQTLALRGEWPDAAQFLRVCERIWPYNPAIETLRSEITIRSEEYRIAHDEFQGEEISIETTRERSFPGGGVQDPLPGIPGQRDPVSTSEALTMAREALAEERYFDAHWLAALGERLARPGGAEIAEARRIASRAWNGINSLEPTNRASRNYSLYHRKLEGYEAMLSAGQKNEDWVRAYYIFRELHSYLPEDPDINKYLALCETGLRRLAFFSDELEMGIGEILTGAVFSLPMGVGSDTPGGRMVLRISSLQVFADVSYGIGIEAMVLDRDGRIAYRIEAPYAKVVPLSTVDTSRVLLLLRTLDRFDPAKHQEPVITSLNQKAPGDSHLVFDMNYERFLLLFETRRGPENMTIPDLLAAVSLVGQYGYLPQVFQAELLYRFSDPLFFLPIVIFTLVIGWRFRASKKFPYLGIPMLFLLPVVFNGIVYYYRLLLNNMGIWAVLNIGFTAALYLFPALIVLVFILAMVILASQHE